MLMNHQRLYLPFCIGAEEFWTRLLRPKKVTGMGILKFCFFASRSEAAHAISAEHRQDHQCYENGGSLQNASCSDKHGEIAWLAHPLPQAFGRSARSKSQLSTRDAMASPCTYPFAIMSCSTVTCPTLLGSRDLVRAVEWFDSVCWTED